MEINLRLRSLRLGKGLSFRSLSKAIKIPSFRLKGFESGTCLPSSNELTSLASFYRVDIYTLETEKEYSYIGRLPDSEPSSFSKKNKGWLQSRVAFVLAIILLGGGLSYSALSLNRMQSAEIHPDHYFSSSYNAVMDYTLKNGARDPFDITKSGGSTWYDATLHYYLYSFPETSNKTVMTVSAPTATVFYNKMLYSFSGSTSTWDYELDYTEFSDSKAIFTLEVKSGNDLVFSTKNGVRSKDSTYASSFTATNGEDKEFTVHYAKEGESGYELYHDLETKMLQIVATTDEDAVKSLDGNGLLKKGKTFLTYLLDQSYSCDYIAHLTLYSSARLMVYLIILFLDILIVLAVLPSALKRFFLSWETRQEIFRGSAPDARFKKETTQKAPLPKDIKFQPFIGESVLRFLGIILIAFGSLSIFFMVGPTLNIFGSGVIKTDLAKSLVSLCNFIVPLATILLFFTKIDILQKRDGLIKQVVIFFFAGLLFYAEEICLLYIAIRGLGGTDMISILITQGLSKYMPENLFWSISIFAFISLFLFTTPKFANTKTKLTIYRLISVLPFAYLIGSFFFNIAIKTSGLTVNPFIRFLFGSNSATMVFFALLYFIGVFLAKSQAERKYGLAGADLYETGGRYTFREDIFACIILALLSILDFALSFNASLAKIGFGKNTYLFILIPFILFYRPWHQDRRPLADFAYIAFYGLGFADSVILLGIYFIQTFGWIEFDFFWMFH